MSAGWLSREFDEGFAAIFGVRPRTVRESAAPYESDDEDDVRELRAALPVSQQDGE